MQYLTVSEFARNKEVSRQAIHEAIKRGELATKDFCNITFLLYNKKNISWKPSERHVLNGKGRVKL